MEQIYMIPVNEAFDKCMDDKSCGCPVCALYKKLQEDELDLVLGASMMEPDVRKKTNELGFCLTHFNMMLPRRRMLGMGLILESHLAEVAKKLAGPVILGDKRKAAIDALGKLEDDCYICQRVEKNLEAMIATIVYLYECDHEGFRKKFKAQPWFCLPHYRQMLLYASKKMNRHIYADFYKDAYELESAYLRELTGDVSWFCKKFDYLYDKEPWYNSKDSVKRATRFLGGCFGDEESPNLSGQ